MSGSGSIIDMRMAGIEYIRTEVPLSHVFNPGKTTPVITFGSISFAEAQRLHFAAVKPAEEETAVEPDEQRHKRADSRHISDQSPEYDDDADPVKLLLDPRLWEWKPVEGGSRQGSPPRGLVNLGNTCYANVVMQTLQLCPCLRQVCRFVTQRPGAFSKAPILRGLAAFTGEVNAAAWPGSGAARPDVFLCELERFFSGQGCRPKLDRNGQNGEIRVIGPQQDAQEFLGFVLDALQEEQIKMAEKGAGVEGKEGVDDGGWMEAGKGGKKAEVRDVGQSHESIVSALFQGTLRSILRAGGAKSKQSVTMQPFYTLPLEVSSKNIASLMDGIEQYMEPSYVDINLSRRQKVLQFDRLPMVFVFHLKRFAYSRITGMSSKVRKAIQYPPTLSLPEHFFTARYKMERTRQTAHGDMHGTNASASSTVAKIERESYRLLSVVLHKGTQIAVGHYTNYTYDFFHDAWFYFDDHIVSPIQECPMDHPDAYLLFYVNEKLITPSAA